MTLFEVMAALSATFALGIPTFMEKVMRPKYEERFSEFREARRDSFIDEFEKALPQLKQAKQELTPEIIETMESLFNEWEEVKSDENKLTVLLNCRKFFFIFWLVSCATSLFAIQYSENVVIYTPDITFGQVAQGLFIFMLLASFWYGYNLFNLDEKLSKTKKKTTGEPFGKAESLARAIDVYIETERKVEEALKRFGFPYEKKREFTIGDKHYVADFIIPKDKPKYVIEVKAGRVSHVTLSMLSDRFQQLKDTLQVTTILITNTSKVLPRLLDHYEKKIDYIIDFQNLEKLKEIIKL